MAFEFGPFFERGPTARTSEAGGSDGMHALEMPRHATSESGFVSAQSTHVELLSVLKTFCKTFSGNRTHCCRLWGIHGCWLQSQ